MSESTTPTVPKQPTLTPSKGLGQSSNAPLRVPGILGQQTRRSRNHLRESPLRNHQCNHQPNPIHIPPMLHTDGIEKRWLAARIRSEAKERAGERKKKGDAAH